MNAHPGDLLLRHCVGKQNLFLSAPYIKADALAKVLDAASSISSLTCVTRWQPHDLAAGVSDVECRTMIIERGGSFWLHPSLHAKYYRLNDVVLVGSANLTLPGMGWAAQSNLEILIRAGDDFNSEAFQQELLTNARQITDEEFLSWNTITKSGAEVFPHTVDEQSILHTWRPSTRDPRNLELAYIGQVDEIASFDEQIAARRDIQSMQVPLGLNPEQFRAWLKTCLLAAPFTNTVIGLKDAEIQVAVRDLSQGYGLTMTEARRDMETVRNWLAFFGREFSNKA